MSTDRRGDEVLAVLKLAQKWLANCVPVADLDGPKPLPKIARLIAKLQSGDPGVAVAPPPLYHALKLSRSDKQDEVVYDAAPVYLSTDVDALLKERAPTIKDLASAMKKLLPPELLAEVRGYLDPLGCFEEYLQARAVAPPIHDVERQACVVCRRLHDEMQAHLTDGHDAASPGSKERP